ncbi:hypothetical protein LUZ60_008648 [Juncus effusus]|nr:hypothetical protein LUZ60_008648 [Juncus effusus]
MDYQHYQKSLINPFHHFKFSSLIPVTPSPFFIQIKFLLNAYIFPYTNRAIRAVKNLNSIAKELFYNNLTLITKYFIKLRGEIKERKKIIINSITMHINYSSSLHIVPINSEQVYYESSWNNPIIPIEEPPLAGYLQWFDKSSNKMTDDQRDCDNEKSSDEMTYYQSDYDGDKSFDEMIDDQRDYDSDNRGDSCGDNSIDIDRLAESFISSSYEKFMIEKQESFRRFQEMMARSL